MMFSCADCGLCVTGQTPDGHNCVQELVKDREVYLQQNNDLKTECKILQSENEELRKKLSAEYMPSAGASGAGDLTEKTLWPFVSTDATVSFGTCKAIVGRIELTNKWANLSQIALMDSKIEPPERVEIGYIHTSRLTICADPTAPTLRFRPKHWKAKHVMQQFKNMYRMDVTKGDTIDIRLSASIPAPAVIQLLESYCEANVNEEGSVELIRKRDVL